MIGWVTTWDIRCGIATYSKHLSGYFDDVIVLCQDHEGVVPSKQIIPCWNRHSNDFSGILSQISILNLQTIVIQHQPGLIKFSYLNELLLILSRMEIKVFITMHNTRDRSIIYPSKRIERVAEGLKTCSTVMVHSSADVERLLALGVSENVVMIPHGIYPPPKDGAEKIDLSGKVIGTFGFLLPHKGQIELIEAFAKLSGWDKLILLCAHREGTGRTLEKCQNLITKHQLEGKVILNTNFLDDDMAIATLSQCELLVFPYQNTKESASGAVRMGVAAGVPIMVTPIPIFADIKGAIQMNGLSPKDIVDCIESSDENTLKNSRKQIISLRDSLQWDEVAKRIQALL